MLYSTAAMLVAAGCTTAYAWLAGPALAWFAGKQGLTALPDIFSLLNNWIEPVVALALLLTLLALLRSFAQYCQQISTAQLAERATCDLRHRLFDHLLRLHPAALRSERAGSLASRLGIDVVQTQSLIGVSLVNLLRDFITALSLSGLLFYLQPFLALALLIVVPAVAALVARIALSLRKRHVKAGQSRSDFLALSSELARNVLLLRSFQSETFSRNVSLNVRIDS
ncbi:MAG: hypothetical protein IPJ88_13755 [Myxococcales bacterium]|nr:MAG: hypothetical protein IPJ88_13755 [Myxococcales bacterium]